MRLAVRAHLMVTLQQQRAGSGDGEHRGPAQGQIVGENADLNVGGGHQESGSDDQDQGNDGDDDLNRDVFHDNVLLKKVVCDVVGFSLFWGLVLSLSV